MKSILQRQPFQCVTLPILVIVIILVSAVNILRFFKAEQIPYGFHVDELSTAVTIGCLATQGVDAHNRPYPLFSELNYGTPKPPTYIYPAVAWSKLFGYSVPSLRIFTAAIFILSLVGLFFLARF